MNEIEHSHARNRLRHLLPLFRRLSLSVVVTTKIFSFRIEILVLLRWISVIEVLFVLDHVDVLFDVIGLGTLRWQRMALVRRVSLRFRWR